MPKVPSNFTPLGMSNPEEVFELHEVADKIEPRLARAFERAMQRLSERISINELQVAIALGNIDKAMSLIPDEMLEDVLSPLVTIIRETTIRGGKLGASDINEMVLEASNGT